MLNGNKLIFVMIMLTMFMACTPGSKTDPAQHFIDQACKAHGSELFDRSTIEFKFRDRNYKSSRLNGKYRYERFWDSAGVIIHDELTNGVFVRHVGQIMVKLDSKKINSLLNSVNAVFYFFALPFNLNDPAVVKEYLGEVTILDQRYDKIKITFKPNPNDRMIHDDAYVYWVNKKGHTIDFLGYNYTEPDEKGSRFRQAINRRKIQGLTVQDYINFKPIIDSIPMLPEDLDQAWVGNQLQELSKIINENVRVTLKK